MTPILQLNSAKLTPDKLIRQLVPIQQQTVTISLEAVVLRDGTALGSDGNQTVARIRARLDAEQQLLQGAVQAWDGGGPDAMSTYLQGIISNAVPANGEMAVINAKSPDVAYAMSLSDARSQLAKSLLSAATNNPAAFATSAKRTLSTKLYPSIHR